MRVDFYMLELGFFMHFLATQSAADILPFSSFLFLSMPLLRSTSVLGMLILVVAVVHGSFCLSFVCVTCLSLTQTLLAPL